MQVGRRVLSTSAQHLLVAKAQRLSLVCSCIRHALCECLQVPGGMMGSAVCCTVAMLAWAAVLGPCDTGEHCGQGRGFIGPCLTQCYVCQHDP